MTENYGINKNAEFSDVVFRYVGSADSLLLLIL